MNGMGRTAQNGRDTSAARLLGLLAVLLGLLAVHGLAGGHHAAAASPLTPAVAHAAAWAAHDDGDGRAGHGHAHDLSAAAAADRPAESGTTGHVAWSAAPALPEPAACDGDCRTDVALVCLAVLATAGAVALLAAACRRRARPRLVRHRAAGLLPPQGSPPAAPDPVEDLCVSRT